MLKRSIVIIAALLLAGCAGGAPQASATPTAETSFSTPTLPPTATKPVTPTLPPPTVTPTPAPLSVSTNGTVNIHAYPGQESDVLELAATGAMLIAVGRDVDSAWLAIQLPSDPTKTGWISAEFVTVSKEMIVALPVLVVQTPTPIGQAAPAPSGPVSVTGTLRNEIFVRSGPGQIYKELGSLPAGTQVTLTGRNETDVWAQVKYDKSPTGVGWVASAYIDGADYTYLPYYDNQGNLIPGQTSILPTTIPQTMGQPTPTGSATAAGYAPATADADSRQAPSVSVVFSPSTSKSFQFQSQVSSPNGDAEDWFTFTPYAPGNTGTYVYLRLDCTGNGGITSYLYTEGTDVPADLGLHCGNYGFALKVVGGKQYSVRLVADGSVGDVRLVDYIFYVSTEP